MCEACSHTHAHITQFNQKPNHNASVCGGKSSELCRECRRKDGTLVTVNQSDEKDLHCLSRSAQKLHCAHFLQMSAATATSQIALYVIIISFDGNKVRFVSPNDDYYNFIAVLKVFKQNLSTYS